MWLVSILVNNKKYLSTIVLEVVFTKDVITINVIHYVAVVGVLLVGFVI